MVNFVRLYGYWQAFAANVPKEKKKLQAFQ